MKTEIKNYRITVLGETGEIRELITGLCHKMGRHNYEQLKSELSHLEDIVELEQYTYGMHHRIYYSKDMFMYIPNCSSKGAQRFHYNFFKKYFNEVVKEMKR